MIIIKKGSTPTLLIKKDERIISFDKIVFTFQDVAKTQLTKEPTKIVDDVFYIDFLQQEIIDFASGSISCEAQYIFADRSEMTFTSNFSIIDSLAYEPVTGEGNSEIINANEPLKLDLINAIVESTEIVGGVATVNSKTPDEKGNVDIVANDINFTDGENFQQKYDSGELKGQKGDTGAQGIQGVKGDKGDTGPEGKQGIQGLKGDQGEQGIQGEKGDIGLTGEKGEQGEQGLQGLKGDTGEQGLKGDKGDKGDAGENGTNGADGKDGLTTSISVNSQTYTQVSGKITLPDLALPIQQLTYTSAQFASGIACVDNQISNITGELNNAVIITTNGIGLITFVSGVTVFTLPDGADWNGNEVPTFETGKYYNVSYVNGTFYADGGR